MTIYAHATTQGATAPAPLEWTPWIRSSNEQETAILAARKFLRERFGGFITQQETVVVYTYAENAPAWPNGSPRKVNVFTLVFGRETFHPTF